MCAGCMKDRGTVRHAGGRLEPRKNGDLTAR